MKGIYALVFLISFIALAKGGTFYPLIFCSKTQNPICFPEFKCFVGQNDNLVEEICTDCTSDSKCMCATVPADLNGSSQRFCVANDDDTLVTGCNWEDIFQGVRVDHCYCETSLCNHANSFVLSAFPFVTTFIFLLLTV